MTTIAVTGATGQLGRLVVERLLERSVAAEHVVAIVRDPAKAGDLEARGVDVRLGDYADANTLPAALAGVDVLLLISGQGRFLAQHAAVIDAARQAGVRRVVYTSTLRAGRTQLAGASEHLGTEQHLQGSGLDYTILRNGQYLENHTSRMPQFLAQGEIVGATADKPLAAAIRADYAAAAAAVLVQDDHAAKVYELGGTPFTLTELAAAITDITGTTVAYRDLSSDDLVAFLKSNGVPESFVGFAVELDEATAAGAHNTDSGDLQRLLGRPSTPLADAVKAAAQQHTVG
ncbi:MAG: SDR family oxidoreductase [Candidatus Dormibacteraeota bacterium]|nr:SDR family oxidoreductase [Candidatus Dormibacteraeota bacterium]